MKKSISVYLLAGILLFQSISGLYGGVALIHDISGRALGMSSNQLHVVFSDFLIPGLFLAFFLGILPLFVFLVLIFKPKWSWPDQLNLLRDHYWGWTFSLYISILLIAWIDVQLMIVQEYNFLQPVFSLVGVTILILTLWPSTQQYYKKKT